MSASNRCRIDRLSRTSIRSTFSISPIHHSAHKRRRCFATLPARSEQLPGKTAKRIVSPLRDESLLKIIQDNIKSSGAIPVPLYMTMCLAHPTLGYYARKRDDGSDPFGVKGDFVTSPEVSQVFGEILAVWLISRWQAAGTPKRTRIVELGPGRGTLMADMIRTFGSIESFRPTFESVHLIETSETLKAQQGKKLVEEMKLPELEVDVRWWERIEDVPPEPDVWTMVVAHEFFDALPIHIFENASQGFREVLVDNAPPSTSPIVSSQPPAPLRFVLSRSPTLASAIFTPSTAASSRPSPSVPPASHASSSTVASPLATGSDPVDRFRGLPTGSRVEISPASTSIAEKIGVLVGEEGSGGGAGLVVDYGDDRWFGNSFRGFRKHRIVDPLTEPGLTDLTANVDFSALKTAMSPHVDVLGLLPQHAFLTSLGLPLRLALLQKASPTEERKKAIALAGERLIDLRGMGGQYKVMGFESRRNVAEGEREGAPFVREEKQRN